MLDLWRKSRTAQAKELRKAMQTQKATALTSHLVGRKKPPHPRREEKVNSPKTWSKTTCGICTTSKQTAKATKKKTQLKTPAKICGCGQLAFPHN